MRDLKFACRQLLKNPGFTAVAVLTLALGIGANTAIFSIMDAAMYRDLPVTEPGRLVMFGNARAAGSTGGFPNGNTRLFSYLFYRQLLETNQTLAALTATLSLGSDLHATVDGATESEPVKTRLVSGTFFSTLGVNSILGRTFTPEDDQTPGKHPVAVASYSWWSKRFGRDTSVIGKTIQYRSTTYTIVGVTPPEFFGASPGELPDLWIPLAMQREISPGWNGLENKMFQSLYLLGRLKPGARIEQASAEVNVRFQNYWKEYPGRLPSEQELAELRGGRVELLPAAQGIARLRLKFSTPLHILMTVVALVLVIACGNIASLLLARAASRSREIAVRMAMGAQRARLVRQLLTESAVLALLGAGLGVLFAMWASHALLALGGENPLPLRVSMDFRILAFTLLVSGGATILFGVAPAIRATRVDLIPTLKTGRGVVVAESRNFFARGLVVSQVALCLVLLAGSGLFLRSLVKLTGVNTGYTDPGNALVFSVDAGAAGFAEDAKLAELYRQIEERVAQTPGIKAASFSFVTFNQGGWTETTSAAGHTPPAGNDAVVQYNPVGASFFTAMGLPVLAGRAFASQDTPQSPRVAVVNETMARRFFGGEPAVGKRFGIGGQEHANDFEVIGVVKDAKYQGLDESGSPVAYLARTQRDGFLDNLVVRFTGDVASATRAVRQAIQEINPRLPVSGGRTLAKLVNNSIEQQRLIALFSTAFGLLAVFLACLGIYGLLSYGVSRRTNEIGIRMALGAKPGDVLRLIMREAVLLVAIGVVAGIPAVVGANHLIRNQLFGLSPNDPATLLLAPALLAGVAMVAGYLPARRAARVDPMVALRQE